MNLNDEAGKEFVSTLTDHAMFDRSELATRDFVEKKISESKNELIKWMFAFWVGQIAVIGGVLMYFLKK